jgi:Flp pilus assembly pilin Flp
MGAPLTWSDMAMIRRASVSCRSERGSSAVEYILVTFLVAIAAIASVAVFGENLRSVFATTSNALAGAIGPESSESASHSTDIKVIGRLQDTAKSKGKAGYDVLDDPNWTLARNDEWINSGIRNKQDFYISSDLTPGNLVSSNPKYPGETVFAREIRMLKEAGYVRRGDYLVHPDNAGKRPRL